MVNGETLIKAIFSASECMKKHSDEVNGINVFPVPDGDTGTNLSLTLSGCAKALKDCPVGGVGIVADYIAGELLRCARGNSGVIFSLIFKGFAECVDGFDYIDAPTLAKALETGCNEAYAAIEKPAEGTMLTVIRLAAAKAVSAAKNGKNAKDTFAAAVSGARASLKKTPDLLPVLKKHGVVDAGGRGLVLIMESMLNCGSSQIDESVRSKPITRNNGEIVEFAYCTEFLINNTKNIDIKEFRCFLSEIGDCPAAAEHSGIIKVHVHTNRPDKALEKALGIGELSDIKIDNMRYQSAEMSR